MALAPQGRAGPPRSNDEGHNTHASTRTVAAHSLREQVGPGGAMAKEHGKPPLHAPMASLSVSHRDSRTHIPQRSACFEPSRPAIDSAEQVAIALQQLLALTGLREPWRPCNRRLPTPRRLAAY